MKEQVIGRINKMGRVGQIVTLIVKVITIVLLAFMVALTILAGTLMPPLDISVDGTANVAVDLSKYGVTAEDLTGENGSFIGNFILDNEDGVNITYSINGNDYTPEEVTVEDGIVHMMLTGKDITVLTKPILIRLMVWADILLALFLVSVIFFGRLCRRVADCRTPFAAEVIDSLRNFTISLVPWVVVGSVVDSIFRSATLGGTHMSFSLNLGMLVLVILLFVLVRIFRYGAMLQQESDETI